VNWPQNVKIIAHLSAVFPAASEFLLLSWWLFIRKNVYDWRNVKCYRSSVGMIQNHVLFVWVKKNEEKRGFSLLVTALPTYSKGCNCIIAYGNSTRETSRNGSVVIHAFHKWHTDGFVRIPSRLACFRVNLLSITESSTPLKLNPTSIYHTFYENNFSISFKLKDILRGSAKGYVERQWKLTEFNKIVNCRVNSKMSQTFNSVDIISETCPPLRATVFGAI
jgi:hypothetical protein